MRALFLLSVVLLAGCNLDQVEPDPCDVEKETTQTIVGGTGLVLQPSTGMFLTFDQIEQAYMDTEQCMGISAQAPTVAFRDFDHFGIGGYLGITIRVERTVWVNNNPDPALPRDCDMQRKVLKHEFVHHILNEAGVVDDYSNKFHGSPFFDQCGKV